MLFMKKLFLSVLFILFATPALALCASAVFVDVDGLTVRLSGNDRTFFYDDLPNGGTAKRAADLEKSIQDWMDVRQTLASIPIDDPDKSIDPLLATIYWGDIDGKRRVLLSDNDFLVSRCANVEIGVIGNGKNDFSFRFSTPTAPPVIE